MSTTRCKQTEDFGPSPIQDYKFCSPRKTNKPSTESLESIVRLSSISPRYYRPHGITVNVVPITAVSPRLPRYSRRPHYCADL